MDHKAEFGFVIEYVTDMETAKRFYVDVMGLKAERESPVFVQFNHFALASDESMSGSRDSEIYWVVENIETTFKELSNKAEINMPIKSLPFGKVFSIKDPAGSPQYFVEFAKNRPSQAVV